MGFNSGFKGLNFGVVSTCYNCICILSLPPRGWPYEWPKHVGDRYVTQITFIQGEHKVLPWLQTFITRKPCIIQIYFFFTITWIVFQQDGAPPHWGSQVRRFLAATISKQVDWERDSDTLAATIAGYHPPWLLFYGGMLKTMCFRHQFQILQIWRQE